MDVNWVVQQVLFVAFQAVWAGGAFALMGRLLKQHFDDVRRFPPVNGVRLETFTGGNPFGLVAREIRRLGREPQDDPELELLRRALRRTSHHLRLWIFGFPLLTLGVAALLRRADLRHREGQRPGRLAGGTPRAHPLALPGPGPCVGRSGVMQRDVTP